MFCLSFAILLKFNKKSVFLHILVNVASLDLNSVVSLVWTSIAKLYENTVFAYLDKSCKTC